MQLQQVQKGTIMKSPLGKSMRKVIAISFIAFVGTGTLFGSYLYSHFEEKKKQREELAAGEQFTVGQDLGRKEHLRTVADSIMEEE